jgi:hypothetical protein
MIYRKVSSASTEEGLVVYPPPPPPVATGPGLDRPLQAPQPEYVESPGPYTMMRTARFYQVAHPLSYSFIRRHPPVN